MKNEVRIIAWDDCAFSFTATRVRIIGVIFRGAAFMDGLLSAHITKDGMDATETITRTITTSRHYDQLSYIMLDGITLGGLNIVDLVSLYDATQLPVIAVQRKPPNVAAFRAACKKLDQYEERERTITNAGKHFATAISSTNLYFQKHGCSQHECEALIQQTCVRSHVPEPLRVAHLIASGLSGESRGRA